MRGCVCARGGGPALFAHPLNGLPAPTTQTEGSSHTHTQTCILPSNAHSIKSTHSHMPTSKHTFPNALTHALITHAFPLPTVTGKQCPPLPSQSTPPHPSPHFTSPPTGSAPLPFFFVVGAAIEEFLPCYRR